MARSTHPTPASTLRARYVFPIAQPPIENGYVTIDHGRIVAVGKAPVAMPSQDLGDVALLPGLVNAHTHLEFSDLAAPLGSQGNSLVDWIRTLMAHRRAASGQAGADPENAIRLGLAESKRLGVTTLADIVQPNSLDAWANASQGMLSSHAVFVELLAPTAQRVPATMAIAQKFLSRPSPQFARAGLSPHAPYSVHSELLHQAMALAVSARAPVAMHLAESPEEMELLATGQGPMREFLESIGAWEAEAWHIRRPLDYLQSLARAERSLVVHGNFLGDEEIAFAARHRDRMAVVYCPRTHAWFGHKRYPLEEMLSAGVLMALGTDSRASNPDLSVLAEMRYLFKIFPAVSPADILELGTLGGAQALGVAAERGSLEVGKLAHLCAVPLPGAASGDPYEMLLGGDLPVSWLPDGEPNR